MFLRNKDDRCFIEIAENYRKMSPLNDHLWLIAMNQAYYKFSRRHVTRCVRKCIGRENWHKSPHDVNQFRRVTCSFFLSVEKPKKNIFFSITFSLLYIYWLQMLTLRVSMIFKVCLSKYQNRHLNEITTTLGSMPSINYDILSMIWSLLITIETLIECFLNLCCR